jgi:uncharacterized protein
MAFYLITFAISWLCWIPAAIFTQNVMTGPWVIPYLLGGFGPSVTGVIFTYRGSTKEERRDFWKRTLNFRQISPGWQLFIWLIFPAIYAASFLLDGLINQNRPGMAFFDQVAANPLIIIGTLFFVLLAGPVSEELGWRGYALDRLQDKHSPLVASLILGVIWWVWHLPLFFIQGTTHFGWGFGSLNFFVFLIGIFPLSVMMTWVYNKNRRSILAAILLHFTYPLTINLVYPFSDSANLFHALFLSIAAVVMILVVRNKPGFKMTA